jgi:hypothetical protein
MKRASKVERSSLDKQQGERAREEDLRERFVVESRIRSILQGRIPTPPL